MKCKKKLHETAFYNSAGWVDKPNVSDGLWIGWVDNPSYPPIQAHAESIHRSHLNRVHGGAIYPTHDLRFFNFCIPFFFDFTISAPTPHAGGNAAMRALCGGGC